MTQTISQTKNLTAVRNDGLEHAFDFDLQAAPGREPFVSTKNREGAFIVNGVGTVNGEMIHGKIKMSFFAIDCAYLLVQAGVDPRPGQHLCKENDGGVIETEDGAQITFDTKGYGLRGSRPFVSQALETGNGGPVLNDRQALRVAQHSIRFLGRPVRRRERHS